MDNTKSTENRYIDDNDGLQIMIFTIDEDYFAINIADVREIMKAMPVTPMQNAQRFIEGVFKPRTKVITVIDLGGYFGLPASPDAEHDIFVISSYNDTEYAFHVHTVVGMEYVDAASIKVTDSIVYGGEGVANGIVEVYGKLVTILNLDKVLEDIDVHKIKRSENA